MKVRLVIEYDNDEGDSKTISEELQEWLDGKVSVSDVLESAIQGDKHSSVTITEVNE